jgi:hypothetical protein
VGRSIVEVTLGIYIYKNRSRERSEIDDMWKYVERNEIWFHFSKALTQEIKLSQHTRDLLLQESKA